MKWLSCVLVLACACSSSDKASKPAAKAPPSGGAPAAASPPAVVKDAPVVAPDSSRLPTWLAGHWSTAKGDVSERWLDLGGVMVGIGTAEQGGSTKFFEVMMVHETAAGAVLTAMPNGGKSVDFKATPGAGTQVVFASATNDQPSRLHYQRSGTAITVNMSGSKGKTTLTYHSGPYTPAPALEQEDRTFSKDSAARGGAAWAARFEDRAAMWPIGAPRTVGPAAVAKVIDGGRVDGAVIRWEPTASGMAKAGDLGFTAGDYRIEDAKGKTTRAGAYVTVWRKNARGEWKIAFDTGVQTSPRRAAAAPTLPAAPTPPAAPTAPGAPTVPTKATE